MLPYGFRFIDIETPAAAEALELEGRSSTKPSLAPHARKHH
jgi:hypothetical protein